MGLGSKMGLLFSIKRAREREGLGLIPDTGGVGVKRGHMINCKFTLEDCVCVCVRMHSGSGTAVCVLYEQ